VLIAGREGAITQQHPNSLVAVLGLQHRHRASAFSSYQSSASNPRVSSKESSLPISINPCNLGQVQLVRVPVVVSEETRCGSSSHDQCAVPTADRVVFAGRHAFHDAVHGHH
jgi:hypothetical protein